MKAWNDVVGFAADPAQPFEGPHDLEVAVAALIYALVDAADLQRDALRSLSPEEVARVLSLPRILASAPVETLSSEETNALVAAVGAGAKVDMLQLHAAGQIVAATISYVLPVLEDWADTRRVAEHVASQRRGDLESLLLIDSPGTRASEEARAFDLLREALSVSAKWGGIDLPSAGVAPEPALETRARAALGLGALEPPETAGLDTGAADALAGLPAGIQRAVARILLAYSQWMDALNQPAGAFPTTQAASALNAQGRLLM
ncbi:MAG: hypothetical protein HYT80_03915, partial [Euryarchaeota archaeon]|nr:hypothetical protein [Euryarchaeota archaeon]